MTQSHAGASTGAQPLPEVLDLLIVGGGPGGTAAAFRARELGLAALVIDHDDLMKRIRDYSKEKLILPGFGGGDRMKFPCGGELIDCLRFAAIDKDEMCVRWKELVVGLGLLTVLVRGPVRRPGGGDVQNEEDQHERRKNCLSFHQFTAISISRSHRTRCPATTRSATSRGLMK